jgi:GxxExxY protein
MSKLNGLLYPELAYNIVGAAMEVHRVLGPGFPEEIYQKSLEHELHLRGIPYEAQHHIVVRYKDLSVADYYLDLVADGKIDVELKAVSELLSVHRAQVLTYLKASGLKLGLLINFGERSLKFERIALSGDE